MLPGGAGHISEVTVWGTCTGAGTYFPEENMAHDGGHTGEEETKKEGAVE